MEIRDLSWNESIKKRFNNPLLPRSIRGIIVVSRVAGKRRFYLIFHLDRAGSITIIFVYSEEVFFNPNIEYLKKPSKKICRKSIF